MRSALLGFTAATLAFGLAVAQTTTPSTTGPGTTGAPTTGTTPVPGATGPGTTGTATGLPRVGTTGTPAQLNPSNNNSTTPPSVTTSNANNKTAAAPVPGRNSFTVNEARRRIEAGGFSQVTNLRKDNRGIWRGKGMKDGQQVSVYCDYQGNVGAQ